MRPIVAASVALAAVLAAGSQACSGSNSQGGFGPGSSSGGSSGSGSGSSSGGSSSGSSSGSTSSSGGSSGSLAGDGGTIVDEAGDGSVTVTNTVYAHTDQLLFSVDPATKVPTQIGPFVGTSDSSTDSAVTDLAVNSNGDLYVNSESVVYKAALPSGGTGNVMLTKVVTMQGTNKFFALAFAPKGSLDPNIEVLIGGDSSGSLYSIDISNGPNAGKVVNLGNFGADKSISGNTFELSGDVVFYTDAKGNATGLATIRSCPVGGSGSKCKGDYLCGVDMNALKTAYTSGAAATTLLAGIYGGSTAGPGNGTGFQDVFGLAAWNSTVFGFSRHITTPASAPSLITIDTTSGVGTMVANNFTFTNGWSGAGVTTTVTISVPPPPPPPAQ
jgi:hypothetical protein